MDVCGYRSGVTLTGSGTDHRCYARGGTSFLVITTQPINGAIGGDNRLCPLTSCLSWVELMSCVGCLVLFGRLAGLLIEGSTISYCLFTPWTDTEGGLGGEGGKGGGGRENAGS